MSSDNPPAGQALVEVWGDTADTRHLAWAIVIGIGISLTGFLIANRILVSHVSSPELARAYAMLAGLGGCLLSGVICAFIFQPKRQVVEGHLADQATREEVVAELAAQHGGLGAISDLPPVVLQEMKELEIYELFARHEQTARATPDHNHNNKKAAP